MKALEQKKLAAETMKRGFTLIELLVVVGILGVLATFLMKNVTDSLRTANRQTAEAGVQSIQEACATYYLKHKKMPTSLEQLTEGDDPILTSDKALYDPWDNPYELESKGKNRIVIKSAGEDGQMGTDDDIRSDDKKKK